MNVLMISGDKNILKEGSGAYSRLELQKNQVDKLDVFVWPQIHSACEICNTAKENHYDVVTAQDPFLRGLLAWRIARNLGAKLNLQVHTDLRAQSHSRRMLARFLLRRADSVRVVSEKIKAQVQSYGSKTVIHVLPIYVDINRFRNLMRQPHAQKTILWIGRFESEKDPLAAVNVLREVLKKVTGVKLIMLGSGSLEPSVQEVSKDLPIELPGWGNPAEYLPIADVVLCTSKHESWGASIIESLVAGVPVVSPDVGIAKEAGAIIADPSLLHGKVIEILKEGINGELSFNLPTAQEWAVLWRQSIT
jgi:glycosyltransferase involved in cell wall biosynthesis